MLSGRDVYFNADWGNAEEGAQPLTYEEFKTKYESVRIDAQDLKLIAQVDKLIDG